MVIFAGIPTARTGTSGSMYNMAQTEARVPVI